MNTPMPFPLETVVRTWRTVAEASGRKDKVSVLAACLQAAPRSALPIVVSWLSGSLRQGRIGVGPSAISKACARAGASEPSLDVVAVNGTLEELAAIGGPGSAERRSQILGRLFDRATSDEQDFLSRLLYGELRQGALGGIMADAIARASAVPVRLVRKALMLSGDTGAVARAALEDGVAGLAGFGLRLLHPVQPMLAQTADDVEAALDRMGRTFLEFKLDGARIQVHRSGDEVRVFSRLQNDVTASVPEVVEAVAGLATRRLVLDGETIALRPDGSPHPFQVTMQRFGRKADVEAARAETPLSCFFFDCLHAEGEDLLERPLEERLAVLRSAVPAGLRVPGLVTADVSEASEFFEEALRAGHEGLMAKRLDSAYEAGSRGGAWVKIKKANTLDLVVLAAEWGSGRRRGWLSNLHLGARDPTTGEFVMLGKTFKGLTDKTLEWQTAELLARELRRDTHTVYVRPELVVEIAFNEVQASPRYPGGLALRFARVKGYRPDKSPDQADTIAAVRAIHEGERRT